MTLYNIIDMATPTNKEHFSGGLAKVLAKKWIVDVMLKAKNSDEGSAISAHKLILASRSEVFRKMLELDEFKTSSKQVETITLSDMKQEELEAFVEFIYSDGSMLSANVKQHARSLYLAADKYEILHLRDLCRIELISSLSLSNSLDLLELAQIPFDKVLHDAAFSYIKKNIITITSSDEFKLFVAHKLILASRSEVFRKMLVLDEFKTSTKQVETITLPNLAVEIMKASLTCTAVSCSNCGYYNNPLSGSCCNCGRFGTLRWISVVSL